MSHQDIIKMEKPVPPTDHSMSLQTAPVPRKSGMVSAYKAGTLFNGFSIGVGSAGLVRSSMRGSIVTSPETTATNIAILAFGLCGLGFYIFLEARHAKKLQNAPQGPYPRIGAPYKYMLPKIAVAGFMAGVIAQAFVSPEIRKSVMDSVRKSAKAAQAFRP